MFLKNVLINKFKVLEDINLKFDNTFVPTIYPLASLNGGGKSTFLQLIFILLYTAFSSDKTKSQFLRNILSSLYINSDIETFITLTIILDEKEYKIEFYLANNQFTNFESFVTFDELENEFLNGNYQKMKEQVFELQTNITENGEFKRYRQTMSFRRKLNDIISQANNPHHKDLFLRYQESEKYEDLDFLLNSLAEYFEEKIYELRLDLKELEIEKNEAEIFLKEKSLNYIINCNSDTFLVYKSNLEEEQLQEISEKVFLVAPSTQVFSFLSKDAKKTLFLSPEAKSTNFSSTTLYDFHVNKSKELLKNFFTYEFASTTLIIESFKKARDKDFEEAVETDIYGNNLKKLKKDLDNFLLNKTISVDKNLTRVIFKIKGTKKELEPEDLSHGELKKLGLFIWLKYKHLDDSLILMDEVENGLHPDWQYSIINDLKKWSPTNQYILATHSYEICEALTPSHISELNPKLLK